MNKIDELRHLNEGPKPDEKVPGLGTVRFLAITHGSAFEALANAKKVLTICLNLPEHALDKFDILKETLPNFFVEKFRSEATLEEDEAYLEKWRASNDRERMELEKNRKWTLLSWAEWMKPKNREWWWWDAVVVSSQYCAVAVAVSSWPFPWEALKVLLCNCGFNSVQAEKE